jgi:hypothetical protein
MKILKATAAIILFLISGRTLFGTVTSTSNSVTYTCSGSTGPFSFSFPAYDAGSIEVIETIGSVSSTIPSTQYTITPVNNSFANGGSISLSSACATGNLLTIQRVTEQTQTSSFTEYMPALYKTFEYGLDKLTEEIQDLPTLATSGAVQSLLIAAAGQIYNVKAYGATGNGTTDDTTAISSAETAAIAVQGCVYFPSGTYKTSSPLPITSGACYLGSSFPAGLGSTLINSSSDLFLSSSYAVNWEISHLNLISATGGGHVFNLVGGTTAHGHIHHCLILQYNTAKAVVYSVGSSAIYVSNWWDHNDVYYPSANTVPEIFAQNPGVNANTFETSRFTACSFSGTTCNAPSSTQGTYALWLEAQITSSFGINNAIRALVFQMPVGGAINLLSMAHTTIQETGIYDLAVAPNNPLLGVGTSSFSGAGAPQVLTLIDYYSIAGTSSEPDVLWNTSTSANWALLNIIGGSLKYVKATNSQASDLSVFCENCRIANSINVVTMNLTGNGGGGEGFCLSSTESTSQNYCLQNGYPGNYDGSLLISGGGSIIGSISKSGAFYWGTPGTTQAALMQGGNVLGSGAFATTGTGCTNSELALSGGWGSSASVSSVVGQGQTCQWTITASGTMGANPTITDTLTNQLPSASVVCDMRMVGGTGTNTLINQTSLSATAPVFTFGGTPVSGSTYIVTRRCGP